VRKIEPATAPEQSTLYKLSNILGGENQVREFTFAFSSDKYSLWRVDPDFFNGVVANKRIDRAKDNRCSISLVFSMGRS
jgi:hypothetical protein